MTGVGAFSNARWHVVRSLVSLLFFAVVFVLYFRPKNQLPVGETIAAVLAIEVVAITAGMVLWSSTWSRTLLQTLVLSALLASLLMFFLQPRASLGFDGTFLVILFVELAGLVVSGVLVKMKDPPEG